MLESVYLLPEEWISLLEVRAVFQIIYLDHFYDSKRARYTPNPSDPTAEEASSHTHTDYSVISKGGQKNRDKCLTHAGEKHPGVP